MQVRQKGPVTRAGCVAVVHKNPPAPLYFDPRGQEAPLLDHQVAALPTPIRIPALATHRGPARLQQFGDTIAPAILPRRPASRLERAIDEALGNRATRLGFRPEVVRLPRPSDEDT